jgi:hypothetical protein
VASQLDDRDVADTVMTTVSVDGPQTLQSQHRSIEAARESSFSCTHEGFVRGPRQLHDFGHVRAPLRPDKQLFERAVQAMSTLLDSAERIARQKRASIESLQCVQHSWQFRESGLVHAADDPVERAYVRPAAPRVQHQRAVAQQYAVVAPKDLAQPMERVVERIAPGVAVGFRPELVDDLVEWQRRRRSRATCGSIPSLRANPITASITPALANSIGLWR